MNFGVGTFRVRTYFWPNLNPSLEHLIKVVLIVRNVFVNMFSNYVHIIQICPPVKVLPTMSLGRILEIVFQGDSRCSSNEQWTK